MTESEPAPKYEVVFTEDAKSDVADLDGSIKNQLKKVCNKKLAVKPDEYGTPLRSILAGFWKHEFADHRVIYQIPPGEKDLVIVCAIGPRKAGDVEDIYNQLDRVAKSGRLAEQVKAVLTDVFSTKRKK